MPKIGWQRFTRAAVLALACLLLAGTLVGCASSQTPGWQSSSSSAGSTTAASTASAASTSSAASTAPSSSSSSTASSSAASTSAISPDATESASAQPSTPRKAILSVETTVIAGPDRDSIHLDMMPEDLEAHGFELGDEVDVEFANGYALRGIPYYDGYYTKMYESQLVGFRNGLPLRVARSFDHELLDELGLAEGDVVTINLVEKGTFAAMQEAFDISYTSNRDDYPALTDAQFANFREAVGGALAPGRVYRSASPISNNFNRAAYAEPLLPEAGIAFVLNLSDNAEEASEMIAESQEEGVDTSYYEGLLADGRVVLLDLDTNYASREFKSGLAPGLVELSQHEGPYLVHCIEGKDRTGFVCTLLEALAGASYQEMLDDYMASFYNYYGVTREDMPATYDAVVEMNLGVSLRYLAGIDDNDDADLTKLDYVQPARDYLRSAGMTDAQIDQLRARLTN